MTDTLQPARDKKGAAAPAPTIKFTLDGREFIALNGGPQFTFNQAFSICVQCDTQAEVDRYWDALLQGGGKPNACGWLTDKFGVSWQIDPKMLMQLVTDPDPVKAKKAMSAMITMVKIDSEALKHAVAK